jgi:hypothetical protein
MNDWDFLGPMGCHYFYKALWGGSKKIPQGPKQQYPQQSMEFFHPIPFAWAWASNYPN